MPAVVLRGWLDLGTEGVSMDRTMLSFDAALAPPASGAAGLGASLRSSVAATAGGLHESRGKQAGERDH